MVSEIISSLEDPIPQKSAVGDPRNNDGNISHLLNTYLVLGSVISSSMPYII